MFLALLSTLTAIVVATLGILASGWGNRRQLKDDLDIASRIHELYPEDGELQNVMRGRVCERIAVLGPVTILNSAWPALGFSYALMAAGFVVEYFRVRVSVPGGEWARLGPVALLIEIVLMSTSLILGVVAAYTFVASLYRNRKCRSRRLAVSD